MPFVGLEAHALAAIRRSGVPLQRIRPALQRLHDELGIEHVLASQSLYTDGAEVLYDFAESQGDTPEARSARDLVVVRNSQRVFNEVDSYLRRVDFASDGGAQRAAGTAVRPASSATAATRPLPTGQVGSVVTMVVSKPTIAPATTAVTADHTRRCRTPRPPPGGCPLIPYRGPRWPPSRCARTPAYPEHSDRETLSAMDDYQIPTTDGRHVTLRYDEQSQETILHFPPPLDGNDETPAAFGFTVEDAERFVDALTAIRARASGGAVEG